MRAARSCFDKLSMTGYRYYHPAGEGMLRQAQHDEAQMESRVRGQAPARSLGWRCASGRLSPADAGRGMENPPHPYPPDPYPSC
ncbi:MAG: hypothetical protein AMXMBFR61_19340 [Fimbriimonadales bacterium]